MHLRITEFKQLMIKAAEETQQPIPFTEEQMEKFYKQQCLQQMIHDFELVIGHFNKNIDSITPDNFFDNITAIRDFFGIAPVTQDEMQSEQKGSDFDIDKQREQIIPVEPQEDKFETAEKNLAKKGIII